MKTARGEGDPRLSLNREIDDAAFENSPHKLKSIGWSAGKHVPKAE
jgi:hypothetical protein